MLPQSFDLYSKNMVEKFLNLLESDNGKFFIKKHPRSSIDMTNFHLKYNIFPSEHPLEYYFSFPQLSKIVAFPSSSLISARYFTKGLDLVCIGDLDYREKKLYKILESLDVKIIFV